MADATPTSGATVETRGEVKDEYKFWMNALDLATKDEEKWRKSAQAAIKDFAGKRNGDGGAARYNILYSNVITKKAALYNSVPAPDIRRRFGDPDPDAKAVSQAIERTITA